jgi:hypothetical protein
LGVVILHWARFPAEALDSTPVGLAHERTHVTDFIREGRAYHREMRPFQDLAERRSVARSVLLGAVVAASEQHGATAVHLLGSIGRQAGDAFSDIDAWLTIPDDLIGAAIQGRHTLYRNVGDLLLTHEAASNRPLGGVYTLALYQTDAGPMQVDWYLAPQRSSCVAPQAGLLIERVPVPRGEWQLDSEALQHRDLTERISWLIGMLFIAIKTIVRSGDATFLSFLEEAYREVRETYRLGAMSVTAPTSLAAVGEMLRQLTPYASEAQCRALLIVTAFQRALDEDGPAHAA